MTADLDLRGVYVPLITPFEADGSVALDAIEHLCGDYLDAGATGIVALGTTGESPALSAQERGDVTSACASVCAARGAQLIVGAGTNNTATTVEAVTALQDTPALAGALVVVPYYVRPAQDAIVEHFRAAAAASPVPLVVYNIPMRTGRNLEPAAMLEVAALDNVAGVKQATAGLDLDTLQILAGRPDGFHVLGGEDPFLLPIVLMGGAGAICASSHLCTERFVAMIECGLAGKVDDGRAHAEALLPLVTAAFAEPNPSVFKGVLYCQGRIPTPDLRLPLTPASDEAVERALAAVHAAS